MTPTDQRMLSLAIDKQSLNTTLADLNVLDKARLMSCSMLVCDCSGDRIKRHNAIRDCLFDSCVAACWALFYLQGPQKDLQIFLFLTLLMERAW